MFTLEEAKEFIDFAKNQYNEIFNNFCTEIFEGDEDLENISDEQICIFARELKFEHRFIWKEM